jgi:hypothetical protein
LRDHGGEDLVKLGLKVESLDGDGVALAMRHMRAQRRLTIARQSTWQGPVNQDGKGSRGAWIMPLMIVAGKH